MGNPRIAGRIGQPVDLSVGFYNGGQLVDPFAIRRIDIYREQVLPQNLTASIPVLLPTDPLYPAPITKTGIGQYTYSYPVPLATVAPDVYLDVWYYFPTDPIGEYGTAGTGAGTSGISSIDLTQYDGLLQANCHRFWVYPENWYTDDSLTSLQFGFEPLQQRFHSGESRDLEIGLMPMPLYDYNYNLVMPLMPWITGTIHVETRNAEILIQSEPLAIGLRQGSFRSNPFVLKWRLMASRFLIGTYRYRVTINLPNGVTQVSPWFIFTID